MHSDADVETAARIEAVRAPSYEALRTLKRERSEAFPVYDDLPELLVRARRHPDPDVAFVLATASGYAYAGARTMAMMMARLGLQDCVCRTVAQHVDAMLIETTAHVIQSADGRVAILAYRGTVPMSGISWLNDLDVNPHGVALTFPHADGPCELHGGFYRNVRATRPDVIRALQWALEGRSVLGDGEEMPHPLEALYVTGHSFGGAMASVLAIMLRNDPAYAPVLKAVRAVYTFGAPMVASPALADARDGDARLGNRVFRYVYENDAVPQVPPRACGNFAHFGRELRYTHAHGWQQSAPRRQLGGVMEMLTAPTAIIARQLRFTRDWHFGASLYDHLPAGYVAALKPGGVESEFGG
jgi:hypothetical protein